MKKKPKTEWHEWFCWYPVYSIEFGWVWLRELNRKKIPAGYVDRNLNKSFGAVVSETFTGCWHRIPEHVYD